MRADHDIFWWLLAGLAVLVAVFAVRWGLELARRRPPRASEDERDG